MELLALPLTKFQLFLVCAARVTSMMVSLPLFGTAMVPARIRVGLSVFLSLAVFPLVEPLIPRLEFNPYSLGLLVLSEAILGIMVGFVARLVMTAVEIGGTLIGYQMGFAAANIFDPQNQNQVSLVSQFQSILAILIFLILNIHYFFFQAIVQSFTLLPPGQLNLAGAGIPYLMELSSNMFALGVTFSAPVLVVLLLSGLVLGILARIFPQLNVFLLSFPLNIAIAFMGMGLTLALLFAILSKEFARFEEQILQLLSAL